MNSSKEFTVLQSWSFSPLRKQKETSPHNATKKDLKVDQHIVITKEKDKPRMTVIYMHILKQLMIRSTVVNLSCFIHHGMKFSVHRCCSSLDATNNDKEWDGYVKRTNKDLDCWRVSSHFNRSDVLPVSFTF